MRRIRTTLTFLLLGSLAAWLAACSTDSPSAPKGNPTDPVPPAPVVSTTVTVSVSSPVLAVDSTSPVTVTVRVSRSDGAIPADGSQVTLTTTIGGFGILGTGPSSVTLDLVNGQATAALFSSGTTVGIATLRATFGTAVGTNTVEFRGAAEFFLSSVSPNQGTPNGGTTVTINGGGFRDPVRVTFDGVPAVVQSTSNDRIVVITPRNDPGPFPKTVTVAVTIRANQPDAASDSLPNAFIYSSGGGILQPQILSITPTSGTNDGGTRITINGDGFDAPVQVSFTGKASGGNGDISLEGTTVSVSRTQIVVLSPAASGFGAGFANQPVTITVKNLNSGLQAVAGQNYRYGTKVQITSISATQGPYTGGQNVDIFGSGFEGPVAVGLGGFAPQVLSVTGSETIVQTLQVPITDCNEPTGPVVVTNIDSGDSGTGGGLTYTYRVPKPVITSVSPVTGPQAGGTLVTITGPTPSLTIGFDPPTRVEFASVPGSVQSESTTVIKVLTPPYNGSFPTEACSVGPDTGTRKLPALVLLRVTNLRTGCVTSLANSFAYNPTDGSCVIAPPAPPVASFTSSVLNIATHNMQFIDTSTGAPSTWAWSFGDSATSTLQNPSHAYAAAGNYTVTLTVTNGGGSASVTVVVTVP